MSLRSGIFGFVLLVAPVALAGESGAPLENSKQELKALQKDLATQGGGAPAEGKLKDAMPRMNSPLPGAAPAEAPAQPKSVQELKRADRKNWLVDGMNQLDRNAKTKARAAQGEPSDQKADRDIDDEDPSILKLYGEQESERDEKPDPKPAAMARKDPLQPFLQGWLAESPVRGKFFDEFIRKSDAPTDSNRFGSSLSPDGSVVSVPREHRPDSLNPVTAQPASAQARPNPYLAGLDLTPLPDTGLSGRQTIAEPLTNALPAPRSAPLDAGPAERKAPAPALADDKKYFPQLKKF